MYSGITARLFSCRKQGCDINLAHAHLIFWAKYPQIQCEPDFIVRSLKCIKQGDENEPVVPTSEESRRITITSTNFKQPTSFHGHLRKAITVCLRLSEETRYHHLNAISPHQCFPQGNRITDQQEGFRAPIEGLCLDEDDTEQSRNDYCYNEK